MPTLDPDLIFQRTAQGEVLARTPRRVASHATRATLLLLDGHINVGELEHRFGDSISVADALASLEADGLVERVVAHSQEEPFVAPRDVAQDLAPALPDPLWAENVMNPGFGLDPEPVILSQVQAADFEGPEVFAARVPRKEIDRSPRRGASTAGWWLGALVLAAAILALWGGQVWLAGLKPKVESRASQVLGAPVEAGSVGFGVYAGPALRVRDLVIRQGHPVRLAEVLISPDVHKGDVWSSFSVRVKAGRLHPSELGSLLALFARSGDLNGLEISDLGLLLGGRVLEGLRGTMVRDDAGRGQLNLTDGSGRFVLTAYPSPVGLDVRVSALPGLLPILGGIEAGAIEMTGSLRDEGLKDGAWSLTALGGRFEGEVELAWSSSAVLTGRLRMSGVDAGQVLRVRYPHAGAEGMLSGDLKMAARGAGWEDVPGALILEGKVHVERGALKGMDLGSAVRERSASPISGGETRFESMAGRVHIDSKVSRLVVDRLEAGALSATGQFSANSGEDLRGTWVATVSVPGRVASPYPMDVAGSVTAPQLQLTSSIGVR